MSQVINTNILSLNAQRNLNNSQGALQTSLERLSTGLRINSAKDDAAGLAIAERFTTQIRGLNQAVRNANDGISFSQTAEGALGTIGDALQRARELSVQAANDSNSPSDRQALNDEVQQLIAEVGRVANETEFNGQRVLDGSLDDLFFQVGANQGQMIAVSGVDSRSSELGATEVMSSGSLTQTQINDGIQFAAGSGDITIVVDPGGASADLTVTLGNDVTSLEDAVREINTAIQEAGSNDSDISDARLTAALRVDNDGNTGIVINGAFDAEFQVDGGSIQDEDGVALATLFGESGQTQVNLTEIGVSTREDAFQTISTMDGALTQISSLRAELGAVQVRFENTIANLEISSENLSAARSRIQDADFAAETAELTRAQILQQAGTSVLSQANAVPQNVLALLQ
ncbi:flagellin [Thioalkalivibrio sp. AKL6]|uniref:flagellin N-terminal helical domain-containing protein n=1 Tax=Thioalkalivibrio sp. AKL6 TaxID=1158154 RepID=UPI000368D307|nr:flagellin [Thioalkalivibrio sp. AKL6]